MGEEREIISHPVPVSMRAVLDQAILVGRVRNLVPDPTILNELTPFFWTAEISSTRLDSYFTRMSEKTLQNYVEDANNGVSFQNSHRTNELGLGRSLAAEFIGPQGNGISRVDVTFYTLSGLRLNDLSTDDFIRGVRGGIVRDVSVGFYGGRYVCSICGRDMLKDWDCTHIPGMKYDRVDPNTGRSQDDQMCFAWVDDARLAEVSAVFEGSTPGAAIQKAVREASAGRITPLARTVIEQRYRCALPQKKTVFSIPAGERSGSTGLIDANGVAIRSVSPEDTIVQDIVVESVSNQVAALEETVEAAQDISPEAVAETTPVDTLVQGEETIVETPNETVIPEQDTTPVNDTPVETPVIQAPVQPADGTQPVQAETPVEGEDMPNPEQERELGAIRALVNNTSAEVGVRSLVEEINTRTTSERALQTRVNELTEENGRLATLADMGRQYRSELIEDTIREGIRADGAGFPVETYRVLLDNASIDHVKSLRDGFRSRGDAELAGGRRTVEEVPVQDAPAVVAPRGKVVPSEAFRT